MKPRRKTKRVRKLAIVHLDKRGRVKSREVVKVNRREAGRPRFENFHERAPKRGELVTVKNPGSKAFLLGALEAIQYRVAGERKGSYHRFRGKSRPVVYVSADGREIFIVMGRWRFTSRGFEDRP